MTIKLDAARTICRYLYKTIKEAFSKDTKLLGYNILLPTFLSTNNKSSKFKCLHTFLEHSSLEHSKCTMHVLTSIFIRPIFAPVPNSNMQTLLGKLSGRCQVHKLLMKLGIDSFPLDRCLMLGVFVQRT